MPPNKDAIVSFVGPGSGNEEAMTGKGCYYGVLPEVEEEHRANHKRYVCVEVKDSNPRQVKCHDLETGACVWGEYKPLKQNSKLLIFVPNI